jgi:protein-tyrosine phosphatase
MVSEADMSDDLLATDRDLQLGPLENARDIGGYRAGAQQTVRWGRVFRAASVNSLLPEHREDWDRLGVRCVVDLRRQDERDRRGELSHAVHSGSARHLPLVIGRWRNSDIDMRAQPAEYLASYYISMLRSGNDAFRQLFELLADPVDLPLLLFCAAGKDRTGTAVALVLCALGVDDATICDDYELSGERIAAMVARQRALPDYARDPMVDQPPEILSAPRHAMQLLLNHLHDAQGGVDAYLARIGLSKRVLDGVRANLLEGSKR